MLIEGENLEVLRVLQKSYYGKVKMIYIDPPYNTGNDSFVYPDDYSETLDEYQKRTGEKNEAGHLNKQSLWKKNSKESGQYHSAWLSMMYPRLYLARNLLRDDGVIFISIDDNEAANLKLLCDEVFGAENFVAQLIWERAFSPKNDARFISNSHDYVLMFAKNIARFEIGRLTRTDEANARYLNPDNDPRGVWMSSDISVKTYNAECDYPIPTPSGRVIEPPTGRCFGGTHQDNRIWFGSDGDGVPRIKRFITELKFDGMAPTSIMAYKDVGHSQEGSKQLVTLLDAGVFDGPKPVRLLQRLITLANATDDSIILDFFAGSGTTAQAVMELNLEDGGTRQCICVQMPEVLDEASEAYKAGYRTIADITRARIDKVIAKLKADNAMAPDKTRDLACAQFTLAPSNFKVWRSDVADAEALREQLNVF
jgi:adenine-specific DNA-methyltransferase